MPETFLISSRDVFGVVDVELRVFLPDRSHVVERSLFKGWKGLAILSYYRKSSAIDVELFGILKTWWWVGEGS